MRKWWYQLHPPIHVILTCLAALGGPGGLSRGEMSLAEVQCHLDKEGASDLVIDLIMNTTSDRVFQESILLAIALLEGGNTTIQVCWTPATCARTRRSVSFSWSVERLGLSRSERPAAIPCVKRAHCIMGVLFTRGCAVCGSVCHYSCTCTLQRRLYSASYFALNRKAREPRQLLMMSAVD